MKYTILRLPKEVLLLMKTFGRDKRIEHFDIDLWELVECVTALKVNSSTVIRRCGFSFGSFRSPWGKSVTFFGVNDNHNDGDDDDDDNDNNRTSKSKLRHYYNQIVPACPVLAK
jgi:hypothetical protein